MFRHWTSIISLILLFSTFLVNAGHPLWQFSTKIKRAIPFDLSSPTTTTWPGGIVFYCWDSQATRRVFSADLRHAINLWYVAGLPEPRFRFFELSYEDCMRDRVNSLVIHGVPGPYEFSSTIGKYVGPISQLLPGPLAFFPDEREPAGFGEQSQGKTVDELYAPDGVCVNRRAALDHGWNITALFFTMEELNYLPHNPHESPENEIDWDSLMLYHSNVATKRSATTIRPTIRKFKGRDFKIRIKRSPSPRDVRALIGLYDASEQRTLPRLYHDPRSEYHTAFQNLQNFQACDWPPQGGPSGGGPNGG
ncbi:uncharacterized protein KD926_003240 [Aspergillus affinis]|uniref:uncharacterized protein n=1 Tax=Aspergillus affinis TaxID=1070780 RepID=UPI0022FE6937|nr:uncharacterized protein KD926_003240 [Aspergillus affinis]KAI9035580.1 hypothetical protein KD926_003240 [Aspergillus affinis]